MKVSNRVENSPLGKQYILEVELEGRLFKASHIWPEAYNNFDSKDAHALIERHLWYNLMGAIEHHLKGTLNDK